MGITTTGLSFFVRGVPQTKGSARPYTVKRRRPDTGAIYIGARVTNDNPKNARWHRIVGRDAAFRRAGVNGWPTTDAVTVDLAFHLPRPKYLKDRSTEHCTKPDLDKLVRSVNDALTGVLYVDDNQVVRITATKTYAAPGADPGVQITVQVRGARTLMGTLLGALEDEQAQEVTATSSRAEQRVEALRHR